MHWRLYVCMPVYLFAHQSNTRHLCVYCSCHSSPARNTLRHLDTHTHTGWHLGWHLHWQHGARVWCPQKEAESCNPDPALGEFFGYVLCLWVCALSRDTVVVLSGLRNGTLQPRFPRSLAQHATVTARQLALRLLRGVRSQHYVSECVCVCIVVVCVCLFLYDWVCSNVAQMYESEILPGVYNVFLLRLWYHTHTRNNHSYTGVAALICFCVLTQGQIHTSYISFAP